MIFVVKGGGKYVDFSNNIKASKCLKKCGAGEG